MKPFTMQELNDAINQLNRGKARDTREVNAEMIKYSRRLKQHVLRLYKKSHQTQRATTKLARHDDQSYIQERGPGITIELPTHLFDPHIVQNLESAPLQATTKRARRRGQAGFRPGHSATDHLFTFQQLRQRATEWHQPLWVAAIDFKKAVDTVEHSSIWMALREQGVYDPQRATVHTGVRSKHFNFERGTKQGDSLSTLSFNSLQQFIMKPLTGKWKRCNHGILLVEHDADRNLSNLRFTADILLISGSLKHTTTMLDDITTAATAHGLQLHSTKSQIISNTTSKRGRGNMVAVQGVDILPPNGKIKHFGQLITSQKRRTSRVGTPHQMRVGNIDEPQTAVDVTKVPTERQTQPLRRHIDSITPLHIRNVDDDGTNEEAPDIATTDDEDDRADNARETGQSCAAAQAASVDDTADVDPHDPDSEQEDDTTAHHNQDLNEHEESSHHADSNLCFDQISEDNPEDELEPWVDYTTGATHKADDLLAANGNTWWILRQSQIY